MKFFEKRKCRKLAKDQKEKIKEFKEILQKYENLPYDPIELLKKLVEFFDDVSRFQDKNLFETGWWLNMSEYYPVIFKNLESLSIRLNQCGRCDSGWNRTKKGELVSKYSVYLGGINGINTLTVSDWLTLPKSSVHIDITDKDTGEKMWLTKMITKQQVRPFLESHINPTIIICRELLQQINML